MDCPVSAQWNEFSRADDYRPSDALLVILFEQGRKVEARDLAVQWRPSVPRCAFAGLEVDLTARRWLDLISLRFLLFEAVVRHGLHSGQVVLFGAGAAGELAIEVGLLGVVPGAAVITLDIPLGPDQPIFAPARTSVRMVQHRTPEDPQGARFHALVEALKRQRVDVRSQLLPQHDESNPRVTLRAAGAFLGELVANASRLSHQAGPWP